MGLAPFQRDATDLAGAHLPSVLIAEDDQELADEIALCLRRYSLQPILANDWTEMLQALREERPDAILLDQRLADVDTLPRIPEIRSLTEAPVVVLTGNSEEADRIVGLELGADEFLIKPVSGRELVARLRAVLRRAGQVKDAAPSRPKGWDLNTTARRLCRPDGSIAPLTSAEFDLLVALSAKLGEPISREDLTKAVFRREWRAGDRAVDNAVMRLREKISGSEGLDCISTVRNVGYCFVGFPES